jgi:hypothetical protein
VSGIVDQPFHCRAIKAIEATQAMNKQALSTAFIAIFPFLSAETIGFVNYYPLAAKGHMTRFIP